ncbi:DUF4181 domain-containing protein [Evansella sp. AB-rgal1]|uniref:DUF4181 domain-containing protein n=1 Tax=Evansella sp. AB-rgal1 TaxID=3242696 RepID=UPI00359F0769
MIWVSIFVITLLWFFIGRLVKQKLHIPKRTWGYKHERKSFAILFYLMLISFVLFGVLYDNANPFLLFPFLGVLINLLFSVEQYLFKKQEKQYLLYLLDGAAWLFLGITVYMFI